MCSGANDTTHILRDASVHVGQHIAIMISINGNRISNINQSKNKLSPKETKGRSSISCRWFSHQKRQFWLLTNLLSHKWVLSLKMILWNSRIDFNLYQNPVNKSVTKQMIIWFQFASRMVLKITLLYMLISILRSKEELTQ